MAVAILTGLLFGLGPAISLSGHSLVEAFKDDRSRGSGSGSGRSTRLRQALVISEMAVCMLLLIAAGLLIQTFIRMRAVDLGFNPDGVLTARMSLQGERYAKMEDLPVLRSGTRATPPASECSVRGRRQRRAR